MMISSKSLKHSCIVVLANLFFAIQLFSQVSGGTISGTVTDQAGGALPVVAVSIVNTATGVTRDVTTNTDGFYVAPNLAPGHYDMTFTAANFATQKRLGIVVTVGGQESVNQKMNLAGVSQKVEVSEQAVNVDLTSSDVGGLVGSTTVQTLPLNGRSWTDLTALQPGVATIETQVSFSDSGRGNRGFGSQVAISGARPQQNNYRLDGVSLNDYANGGPAGVLGGSLGVDAIQEFSVITTNASAEYGAVAGGVVNARSRSGSNDFHGSAYEFIRNSAVDAKNFFDAPGPIPSFKRNQFGGSAGGPIIKNRTFIFGDYEAIRQSKGISALTTVPSDQARMGHLCSVPDSDSCKITGPFTVPVDASAQSYLGFYHPANQGLLPGAGGDIGLYTFSGQQVVNEDFLTIRADHKFTEKDSLAATYLFDRTPFSAPDTLNNVRLGSFTKRQGIILEETHMFNPQVLNSFRFGFYRDLVNNNVNAGVINPLAAELTLGAVPGKFAATVLTHGLTDFNGGKTPRSTFLFRWNTFQAYDDAFVTRGLHLLKFGFAFERFQMNELTQTETAGTFNFPSLSAFLQNQPSRFRAAFPELLTYRYVRQSLFGAYVQDDWKIRPNLTLNFGLRYETISVPSDTQGQLSTLYSITDPAPHCGRLVDGCAATGPYFSNPTRRDFQPRIGFAWDPFNDGKTAVRAGFGFYDVLPMAYQFVTLVGRAYPFFKIGSTSAPAPGSFYKGAFQSLQANKQGNYFEVPAIEQKPKRNYVMQWNLNVQRDIVPNLTATLGYVGSRSVHQPFRTDDSDIVLPVTKTSAGWVWPKPIGTFPTINTHFGDIRYLHWAGDAYYDALIVGITKHFTRGLIFQGSYTWGKSIDTSSGVVAGDTLSNSLSSLHYFDLRSNRAVSDYNVARTFVFSATWQLPVKVDGRMGLLANGWELGGIFAANSGVPFTPTFGTDGDPLGSNVSDPWDFPNRKKGPGCGTAVNPGNPNRYVKTECFSVPTAPTLEFFNTYCDQKPPIGNNGAPISLNDPSLSYLPKWACFNLQGNAGRNSLTGPGLINVNFSLIKNTKLSERFTVQLRADAFNVFNHPNFSVPILPNNTDIFDSTGQPSSVAGLLTSTSTTAREIQLALKLTW